MTRHQPGDEMHRTRRGVVVRYSPSQGSSVRYRVTCPHGAGVNARTLADAREDARGVDEWCPECGGRRPTTDPTGSSGGDPVTDTDSVTGALMPASDWGFYPRDEGGCWVLVAVPGGEMPVGHIARVVTSPARRQARWVAYRMGGARLDEREYERPQDAALALRGHFQRVEWPAIQGDGTEGATHDRDDAGA
jgi:hypothetical protein